MSGISFNFKQFKKKNLDTAKKNCNFFLLSFAFVK